MAGVKNAAIAARLRRWVTESGMTQASLAKALGIDPSVLSKQLRGLESIPLPRVSRLAKLLSVPPDELTKVESMLLSDTGKPSSAKRFRRAALDKASRKLNDIGPDGLLLELLAVWEGLNRKQRLRLLELAGEIESGEYSPERPKLRMVAEEPAPYDFGGGGDQD